MGFRSFSRMALVIVMLVLTGCAAASSGTDPYLQSIWKDYPALRDKPFSETVVHRIIDGDTFEITGGQRVRLIGVNTPEITRGKSEAYGQEAKEFAIEKLQDQKVVLFSDVGDTDRYGRLLRYVFVKPDPVMFNDQLLIEGYANTMTVPPNVMFADHFVKLEQQAREQNAGLWGVELREADSDTDLATYTPGCEEPLIKGNINSRNERIYHVPGSRYYESTIAEMMFCTVEEAEEAGFRAPLR